ncbi:MAG TPA: response regulator [Gemmataceae bacterium]|jgi:two-component system CheB/CheR fusion protein
MTATPACPLSVLVVDDYPDTAFSLALVLRIHGHDVRTATSGAEAVGLLAGWRPDVAVLDLVMPGVDGFAVAERLCGLPRRPLLVAVSGSVRKADLDRLKTAAFDHFFAKPVDPAALADLLREYAIRRGGC